MTEKQAEIFRKVLDTNMEVDQLQEEGKVKFGALDQNAKTPFIGNNVPFKLKFSTIGNGVDILTSIKVTKTMDASDDKGNQLGITLNSTQIKLTGYNNFKN